MYFLLLPHMAFSAFGPYCILCRVVDQFLSVGNRICKNYAADMKQVSHFHDYKSETTETIHILRVLNP